MSGLWTRMMSVVRGSDERLRKPGTRNGRGSRTRPRQTTLLPPPSHQPAETQAPPSSHSLTHTAFPLPPISSTLHHLAPLSIAFYKSSFSLLVPSEAKHSVAYLFNPLPSLHSSEPSIAKTLRSEYTAEADKSPPPLSISSVR